MTRLEAKHTENLKKELAQLQKVRSVIDDWAEQGAGLHDEPGRLKKGLIASVATIMAFEGVNVSAAVAHPQQDEHHLIVPGDTEFDLAKKARISLDRLQKANPDIKNHNLIIPGQILNLPQAPSEPVKKVIVSDPNWYIVKDGDTLWSIAKKLFPNENLADAYQRLAKINGIKLKVKRGTVIGIIREGQVLKLKPEETPQQLAPAAAQAAPSKAPEANKAPKNTVVVVKKGDTVWRLAKDAKKLYPHADLVKMVDEAIKANKLPTTKHDGKTFAAIRPGQELVFPGQPANSAKLEVVKSVKTQKAEERAKAPVAQAPVKSHEPVPSQPVAQAAAPVTAPAPAQGLEARVKMPANENLLSLGDAIADQTPANDTAKQVADGFSANPKNNIDNPNQVKAGRDYFITGIDQTQANAALEQLKKAQELVRSGATSAPKADEKQPAAAQKKGTKKENKKHVEPANAEELRKKYLDKDSIENLREFTVEQFMGSIAYQESGGNPKSINYTTNAEGYFQILASNWRKWCEETFGEWREKTPANQVAVARFKMLQYHKQFNGNWRAVAVAWFAGPGAAQLFVDGRHMWVLSLSDGLSTVKQYIDRMEAHLGKVDPVKVVPELAPFVNNGNVEKDPQPAKTDGKNEHPAAITTTTTQAPLDKNDKGVNGDAKDNDKDKGEKKEVKNKDGENEKNDDKKDEDKKDAKDKDKNEDEKDKGGEKGKKDEDSDKSGKVETPQATPFNDQSARVAATGGDNAGEAQAQLNTATATAERENPHEELSMAGKTFEGFPVKGDWKQTSKFGRDELNGKIRYHEGIDIAADAGTPLIALGEGVIEFAGWIEGYGNAIVISYGDGSKEIVDGKERKGPKITTLYGHASVIDVEVGQKVKAGDVVGKVGSTGHSTGPHLHFEVRKAGKPVNPAPYSIADDRKTF